MEQLRGSNKVWQLFNGNVTSLPEETATLVLTARSALLRLKNRRALMICADVIRRSESDNPGSDRDPDLIGLDHRGLQDYAQRSSTALYVNDLADFTKLGASKTQA